VKPRVKPQTGSAVKHGPEMHGVQWSPRSVCLRGVQWAVMKRPGCGWLFPPQESVPPYSLHPSHLTSLPPDWEHWTSNQKT
jgi:hypothetical protein